MCIHTCLYINTYSRGFNNELRPSCVRLYVCVCVCVCLCVCKCICMHICGYLYVYAYTHTHINTDIYQTHPFSLGVVVVDTTKDASFVGASICCFMTQCQEL